MDGESEMDDMLSLRLLSDAIRVWAATHDQEARDTVRACIWWCRQERDETQLERIDRLIAEGA